MNIEIYPAGWVLLGSLATALLFVIYTPKFAKFCEHLRTEVPERVVRDFLGSDT